MKTFTLLSYFIYGTLRKRDHVKVKYVCDNLNWYVCNNNYDVVLIHHRGSEVVAVGSLWSLAAAKVIIVEIPGGATDFRWSMWLLFRFNNVESILMKQW